MNSCAAWMADNRLQWFPELELGFFPVSAAPYDAAYWDRYRRMDRTASGEALTRARVDLVDSYWNGPLVDVGVGGGRFVEQRAQTRGYDVNPEAVRWLKGIGRWCDIYQDGADAATFWDSLEHIADPRAILSKVRHFAFVSLPIFSGPEHVLRSRHFRKDEHFWYFTAAGFGRFMGSCGFDLLEYNSQEVDCGREDIGTFVFGRRAK